MQYRYEKKAVVQSEAHYYLKAFKEAHAWIKKQILSVMYEAFKSLTISNIEILELDESLMTVRVVAEGYASLNIPERVEVLTNLLCEKETLVSSDYAISFEPLTPSEYSEWYGNDRKKSSGSGSNGDVAAKSLDI